METPINDMTPQLDPRSGSTDSKLTNSAVARAFNVEDSDTSSSAGSEGDDAVGDLGAQSPPGRTVKLRKHLIEDGVVYYLIDIQNQDGPLSTYTVKRRFSDFRELHCALTTVNMSDIPELPSSGMMTYMMGRNDKFISQRKEKLQEFMDKINAHRILSGSEEWRRFTQRPDDQNRGSYISLREYAVPELRFSVEVRERKRMQMHRLGQHKPQGQTTEST